MPKASSADVRYSMLSLVSRSSSFGDVVNFLFNSLGPISFKTAKLRWSSPRPDLPTRAQACRREAVSKDSKFLKNQECAPLFKKWRSNATRNSFLNLSRIQNWSKLAQVPILKKKHRNQTCHWHPLLCVSKGIKPLIERQWPRRRHGFWPTQKVRVESGKLADKERALQYFKAMFHVQIRTAGYSNCNTFNDVRRWYRYSSSSRACSKSSDQTLFNGPGTCWDIDQSELHWTCKICKAQCERVKI